MGLLSIQDKIGKGVDVSELVDYGFTYSFGNSINEKYVNNETNYDICYSYIKHFEIQHDTIYKLSNNSFGCTYYDNWYLIAIYYPKQFTGEIDLNFAGYKDNHIQNKLIIYTVTSAADYCGKKVSDMVITIDDKHKDLEKFKPRIFEPMDMMEIKTIIEYYTNLIQNLKYLKTILK